MSMPLRFTIVPNRLDGWRPKRASTRPGTGHVIVPARSRPPAATATDEAPPLGGQLGHRLLEPVACRRQLARRAGRSGRGARGRPRAGAAGCRRSRRARLPRRRGAASACPGCRARAGARATSAAREARSCVKRSSRSRSRRARTATTRAARSKVRASSSEKQQAVVAERHQPIEPRQARPDLRHQRGELGVGGGDAVHGGVDGVRRHGTGAGRLLALQFACLDRQLDLAQAGEERALLGGEASGFGLGLGQPCVEDLRRRRRLDAAAVRARRRDAVPTPGARPAGRRGSPWRSRELPRARLRRWRFPRSCAFWQTPRHDECRPVRSRARPGYRPEADRSCAERCDRHPGDALRRHHRAAAARRRLANGGPTRRGVGRAVGHRGRPAAAPRWARQRRDRGGRRLRRQAPHADGAAGVRPGRAPVQRRGREPPERRRAGLARSASRGSTPPPPR